jgi:dephospho-CoA kinase
VSLSCLLLTLWIRVRRLFSSAEIQLQRLVKRDGSAREEASSRLNSQLPITEKLPYADHVVENSGTLMELEAETQLLVNKLDREYGGLTWFLCWLVPPVGIFFGLGTLVLKRIKGDKRAYRRQGGSSNER